MQEMADPARSLDRARENWQKHGRSQKWIQQRMMGQETRNKLTDYWKDHDITKDEEFAILTNIIHQEWADVSVKEHKLIKGLKTQNLRDHMSEAELIFTALAELSTRQIAESTEARGLPENEVAGKKGGGIAKKASWNWKKKQANALFPGKIICRLKPVKNCAGNNMNKQRELLILEKQSVFAVLCRLYNHCWEAKNVIVKGNGYNENRCCRDNRLVIVCVYISPIVFGSLVTTDTCD